MRLNLSSASLRWLEAQVQDGHFASFEEAIDYSIRLASLRETLLDSIADPRRFTAEQVKANLREHFARRRAGEAA